MKKCDWESDVQVQNRLSKVYALWASLVEGELEEATATKLKKKGCRSKAPKLEWKPLASSARKPQWFSKGKRHR